MYDTCTITIIHICVCVMIIIIIFSPFMIASLPLRKSLTERWQEYTSTEKLRVCVGTWNVNGGKQMKSIALKKESMHDWLLDAPVLSGKKVRQ